MASAYFDTLHAISQPIRAAALPQTLAHVERLLETLGSPQQHYRAVVVTGSTGKGTTCARLATLLHDAGLKVGLYTSPHLHLFRERFALLDDASSPPRLISQAEFAELARVVLDIAQALDHRYSTFEYATALALAWFARQQIDVAVLEIGIGGRFDAVNIVRNDLAIFTPIEAEHVAMLGGSLETVAWHKAGILKPNGSALTVPQTPSVMAVLQREAREKGASLEINADLLAAFRQSDFARGVFRRPPSTDNSSHIALPGRQEQILVGGNRVVIVGGHTPAAARHLRQFIGETAAFRLIVGMLRDKDAAAYLAPFDTPNAHFVYTRAPGDRALTVDELLVRFQPAKATYQLIPSLDEALAQASAAPETLTVIAGSLRMAAAAREAFGLLTLEELEEARLTRAMFEGGEYQKKLIGD